MFFFDLIQLIFVYLFGHLGGGDVCLTVLNKSQQDK